MARETSQHGSWFDRQALISKLLTYAAIVVLLASFGFGGYEVYRSEQWQVYQGAYTLSAGIYLAIAGLIASALIAGLSAIIDLLIVNAEAIHDLKRSGV